MRKLILAAVCLLAPIAAHAEMICRPIPQYPHLLSCYDPVTGASDQRVDDETQRAIDRKNTARLASIPPRVRKFCGEQIQWQLVEFAAAGRFYPSRMMFDQCVAQHR